MNDLQNAHPMVTLSIRAPSGLEQRQKLAEGSTVIVGQGQNCGLRLNGTQVAPMHCVLRLQEGQLTVQDWCSKSGTFLGEDLVTEETNVLPGMVLRVGEYEISHTACDEHLAEIEDELEEGELESEICEVGEGEIDDGPSGNEDAWTEETLDDREYETEEDPELQPPLTAEEPDLPSSILRKSCECPSADRGNAPTEARTSSRSFPLSTDEEAIALMQEEIELLQAELAERDARIRELDALLENAPPATATPEATELDGLMGRLEDLLNELGQGDQRIRSLEEMLRASQEASQAEQEERQQIEKWLNDIESRLTERQAEWSAERDVLTRRLEDQRVQRDDLLRQLEQATEAVSAEVPLGALQKLQSQVDVLQEQLHETDEQRRKAEERSKSMEAQLTEGAYREQIEAAVREERLKLAQERASLSRERAELARLGGEPSVSDQGNRLREADARFQAFRQTLRELHQQESRPAVQKTGLGSRLAELWRRLDGPTDTD